MTTHFSRGILVMVAVLLAANPLAVACESGRPEPVRNVAIASRAGTATLIGFTEYAVTTEPPRKFRRQVTTGTLYTGQWSVAGCPGVNQPMSYRASFPPSDPAWANSSGSASLEPVEVDAVNNRVKYRLTGLTVANHTQSSPWGNLWALRVVAAPADGSPAVIWTSKGQEDWLGRSAARSPYQIFIQGYWSLAGWIGHTETTQSLNVRGAVDRSVRDEWNETVEYPLPTGAVERTGTNARFAGIAAFPLTSGGVSEAWPEGMDPAAAYGSLVTVTTQSTTARRIAGRGECMGAAPRFERAEGSVVQELSLEDTDDDAMARAEATEGADGVAYRDRRTTGFSFAFAEFSFEVPLQVACEGTYLVHFHFERRARSGAGKPERFTRTLEKRLAAGHQTLAPGWFDVAAMQLHLPEGETMALDYDTEYRLAGVEIEQACPDAEPGKEQIWRDSVHVHLSLGRGLGGRSAGRIALEADAITPELYAPGALAVAVPYGSGTTVRRDVAGRLRQVRAPAAFVDIVVTGEAAYEVRFYPLADAGEPDPATGLSVPTGTPYLVYRIENPDVASASRLRVSRIKGEKVRVSEFGQDEETGSWTFSTGNGLRYETVDVLDLGDSRIETITVTGQDGVAVSVQEREVRRFDWGEETVREVRDPAGAALVTATSFIDVPGEPGFGLMRRRDFEDGSYEEWEYDFEDRPVECTRPAADGGVRRTAYEYDELADADGDAAPEQLTTTVETVGEAEVARTHVIRWSQRVALGQELFVRRSEIRGATPGAGWDADGNLVTEVLLYGAGPWSGQTRRRQLPDGTVELVEHRLDPDGRQTTVTSAGAPNTAGDAVVGGTTTTTVTDPAGRTVGESVVDVASGREISGWQATEFDFMGRPVRLEYADGTVVTREYSCCGLAREVDRTGLVTTHRYDDLGRRVETARDGLTWRMELDAWDRITARVRRGTDGSEVRVEARRYDFAGRMVEERDAMDRVTMHLEEMQPLPGIARRHTTTAPDGGTRIEDFNVDGSIAAVAGTAAASRIYRYGVEGGGEFVQEYRPAERADEPGFGGPLPTEWTKTCRDFLGRPWRVEYADGAAEFSHYNARGQLVRQVDADSVTILYAYNNLGVRETTAIDLNGNGQIDEAGSDRIVRVVTSIGERDGRTVERSETQIWTADGNPTPETMATSERSVDGTFARTERNGLITTVTTTYDGNGGRTVTTVGPDGVRETRTLFADRLLTMAVTAPDLGEIEAQTLAYDAHQRLATVTDAQGRTTTFRRLADGQVDTVVSPDPDPDRAGDGYDPLETAYFYDEAGRLRLVRHPDGGEVQTTYWPTGALRRTWGARTYPVEYAYDAQGRLRSLTTWQDFASDAGRAETSWKYDPQRGWLVGKTYADGTGPSYAYYPSGRLRTRTWARTPAVTTTYRYSTAGDLAGTDYSDSTPAVTVEHDRQGRPREVTDGGSQRRFDYDAFGQIRSEESTAGSLQGWMVERGFDGWARLERLTLRDTGAVASAPVHESHLNYDAASRLERVSTGASSATYGYSAGLRQPTTLAFAHGGETRLNLRREHDGLNRLVSISHAWAGAGEGALPSHTYAHGAVGERIAVHREDGAAWSYAYDDLGQVVSAIRSMASGAGQLGADYAFRYDDIGNRRTAKKRAPAPWVDLVETYAPNLLNQYDQRTGPGRVEITGAAQSGATVTVMHPAEQGEVYPVQRQGDLFYAQVPVAPGTDARLAQFRVTGVVANAGPAGEDAVTEEIRSVIVPGAAETFVHDADGNLVADARWTYEWDAENRLIVMQTATAAVASGAPEQRLEFAYDAQSRRVAKRTYRREAGQWEPVTHRLFVYDGWNLLAELDALSDRKPVRLCTWGLDLSDGLQGAGGVGGLLFIRDVASDAGDQAVCFDGNGNVSALCDLATSRVTATYDYGPFGDLVSAEGPAANANPFRFSTKYTDPETGLLYYGYRFYHPSTGRWLNRDPLGEAGGANLYGFIGNEPIANFDYVGLVLVAIDGTGSKEWVFGNNAGSHVLNFYEDWIGPGKKMYLDGPDGPGFGIDWAVETGAAFICEALKENPRDPVFLVGHSRGGLVATKIAKRLDSEGCPCIAKSVPVRFVGLYDAVNMSMNSNSPIPRSVRDVAHGRRDPVVGSRLLWGNTATSGGIRYRERFFKGTHSAMGGDPAHGDVSNPWSETRASADIDQFIRMNATSAGAQFSRTER